MSCNNRPTVGGRRGDEGEEGRRQRREEGGGDGEERRKGEIDRRGERKKMR